MNGSLDRLILPLQRFLKAEAAGGVLLLVATIVALAWANSPWGDQYQSIWETTLSIGIGGVGLSKPLLLWINDGLMAVFFFVVGLEIKREILMGELSSPRKAIIPIAAALGGMLGPALIFTVVNTDPETARGWGVPMATDIAFAVGVMTLLGRRVPLALKIFLTALAIVDDLGAVVVIAAFYTDQIHGGPLAVAGGLLVLLVLANRFGMRNISVYTVLGVLLWLAVLKSGVHATIAGVLLAMTIPAGVRLSREGFPTVLRSALKRLDHADEPKGLEEVDEAVVHDIQDACERVRSPLLRLEHGLLPWVAFVVMPIFALANAGVDLRGRTTEDLLSPVSLGIAAGLFFGNQIGIVGMSWLVVRLGLGRLPDGVSWRQIHGASLLAGIGFTMSLFIAGLAFGGESAHDYAKLGILIGSFASGVCGMLMLWWAGRRAVAIDG